MLEIVLLNEIHSNFKEIKKNNLPTDPSHRVQSPIYNNSKGAKNKKETSQNDPSKSLPNKSSILKPNKVETWEYYEMRNSIIKQEEPEKEIALNNLLDQNASEDFQIQSAESQFITENNDSVLESNEKSEDKLMDGLYQCSSTDDVDFDLSKLNLNDANRRTSAKEMLEGITKRVVLNESNPNASKFVNNDFSEINKLNPRFLNEKSHLLSEPALNFRDEHKNMIFSSMSMNKRKKDIEYNQLLECLSNKIFLIKKLIFLMINTNKVLL